ncbi:MAG TPA: ATP-binding cassette domain-containing protein [Trebonia sp.]|jgi:branched-chain amino acid transport system permease protein|nr:ATP-binding cassette domain-containing protein [Trebonia sp.]
MQGSAQAPGTDAAPLRRRLPLPSGRTTLSVAVCLCIVIVIYAGFPSYQVYDADLTVLAAIAALALNLITGYAGQASIGTAAFLAIGAFTAAGTQGRAGFIGGVVAGGAAAAVAGFVVGVPSLRVRGLYLIITTLVFQYIVQDGLEIIQNKQGALAGYSLGAASIAGREIVSPRSWFLLLIIVLAVCAILVRFLTSGKPGRAWALIRESELAAAVAGIEVSRYKVSAFVISSAMTGVAGALGAFFIGQISYDQYNLNLAIGYVAMIIIGGTGSILGSVIGAIVITDIPFVIQSAGANTSGGGFLSRNLSFVELAINAVLLIIFLLVEPRGLVHLGRRLSSLGGRLARRRDQDVGSPAPRPHELTAAVPGRVDDTPAARAGAPSTAAAETADELLLQVDRLSVRYQGSKLAVDAVSINVSRSEIVAVIGPNGAGRSSLLAGIAGLAPTQARGLYLGGKPLTGLGTMQRAQRGLILVPERDKVFPHLTVTEHLELAASGAKVSRRRQAQVIEAATGYFPGLQERLDVRAGHLSGGERQMLALASSLCLSPTVILIDELSLGLAMGVTLRLGETLRQIADSGIGILLVEQSAKAIESLADRMAFMQSGRLTWVGSVRDFREAQPDSVGAAGQGTS